MERLTARRYVKDPSVVYREIAGEAILVPIRRNLVDMQSIYTLDNVGADIWKLIDGERTLAEIRETLLEEYDVDASALTQDLDEFIDQLVAVGAIRAV
ncbi:MAG: PqqD family protein [Anaerolineae bacterium]